MKDHKKEVRNKIEILMNIFARASVGDFSKDVPIPVKEDEFTPLYVGVQVMLDVIREKIEELNAEKEKIEDDKKQLEILLDSLPVGAYIAEVPSGKPIIVNKRAIELVGRSMDPSISKEDYIEKYDVLTESGKKYPTRQHPLYITIKEGKEVRKSDIVIRKPDGSKVTLKVQSVPVFDKKGNMTSAIAVFDDITREKEIENMKSQFVSLVSHQLRTPLGNMRWNIEMLLGGDYGKLPQEVKVAIKDVYDSNRKLIALVNDILNVSHIEEGRLSENIEKINVKNVIRNIINDIKPQAKEKSVKVTFKVKGSIPGIFIDNKHLQQIIQNIIANAINYNVTNGKVRVTLEKHENNLRITVSDTGMGIPQKDKEKIFDKFYRAENAVKSQVPGSGLGLFIVKSYVNKWGGTVNFSSKEAVGTTFEVNLPLNREVDKSGRV